MSVFQLGNLIWLILLCAWLGVAIIAFSLGWRRLYRVYQRHWYDLSSVGPNEEMKWCQIREIMNHDPLENHFPYGRFRKCSWRYWLWDFSLLLLVLSPLSYFLTVIIEGFCDVARTDGESKTGSLPVDLAVFASVPTIVVAIVALFYQIRLRARSRNRQDWINSIRTEIGALIDSLPPPQVSVRSIERVVSEVWPHYNKLELYLNPNERTHRGFLAIIRFMYGFSTSTTDCEVRRKLCIPDCRFDQKIMDQSGELKDWDEWRMRAVRLANVLLKREWEQVKYVK